MDQTKKQIEDLFNRGILINKDLLENNFDETLFEKIESESDLLVINSDYAEIISQDKFLVDWYELDQYRVGFEINKNEDLYHDQLQHFKNSTLNFKRDDDSFKQDVSSLETTLEPEENKVNFNSEAEFFEEKKTDLLINENIINVTSSMVTVIDSYQHKPGKSSINHFTNFFISRYRFLSSIIRNRPDFQNMLTINRVLGKKDRETVSVIGLVNEIGETRSGNIIITLEDLTGNIKVFISNKNKDLFKIAKDFVVDEVVGIVGKANDTIIFADNIIHPDLPNNEIKKGPDEEYVIFLSDIHVGSKLFLNDEFNRFLRWINGKAGNEQQKEIASKVRYIFIAGDLVDGVGIYPSQEEELAITDISEQYAEFSRLIQQIPSDKKIIICPGNHDAVHLAEPQPVFYQEFVKDTLNLPNVDLVTNPSFINIGKTNSFPGFNVLMYHGYSFDYYVANVESIRNKGGYQRADLIMKFLLKRRLKDTENLFFYNL